ncbi:NAD(P)-binding protein [Mesorhizobium sp. M0195]|uniref:NAD(P)-binding protein n=1 Tax=Mesorhizobium sp. M0195 TaxID=2956910 RepID=UPI003336EF8C
MSEVLDALVIGAGPAGLGVSYFLKRQGRNHRVLDRGRIGETWRTQRWNSFRLNSPTVRSILPGDSYDGPEPWGAKRLVDEYIERAGLDAPLAEDDPAETIEPRLPDPPIRSLDWTASGIRSVIWCTGFTGDFSWVRLPGALDAAGQPVHEDGVGAVPGLFFAGLDFGSTRKSGTIPAIPEETAAVVERLVQARADLPRNGV